jgi:hypothetical protein
MTEKSSKLWNGISSTPFAEIDDIIYPNFNNGVLISVVERKNEQSKWSY